MKRVRSGLGVSQSELAKKMGVGQSFISKIENNIQPISIETIIEISKVLQVCPHTLIDFCNTCCIKDTCTKKSIYEQ